MNTEERGLWAMRLDGDEQRVMRSLSFVRKRFGHFPRHVAQAIIRRLLPPALREHGINLAVLVKFHVAEHLRERVYAVRHALLFVTIGLHHLWMKFQLEESTQAFEHLSGHADQLFKLQLVLALFGNLLQKFQDVLKQVPEERQYQLKFEEL